MSLGAMLTSIRARLGLRGGRRQETVIPKQVSDQLIAEASERLNELLRERLTALVNRFENLEVSDEFETEWNHVVDEAIKEADAAFDARLSHWSATRAEWAKRLARGVPMAMPGTLEER
jgi:hypothetical protein